MAADDFAYANKAVFPHRSQVWVSLAQAKIHTDKAQVERVWLNYDFAILWANYISLQGKGQAPIDHSNYFVAKGSADIVFPTDFDFLCNLYRFTAGKTHMKHSQHCLQGRLLSSKFLLEVDLRE